MTRPNLKWRKREKNRSRQAIRPDGREGVNRRKSTASLERNRDGIGVKTAQVEGVSIERER